MFVILDRAVGGTDRLGNLSLLQAAMEAHLRHKQSVLQVDDFLFYVNLREFPSLSWRAIPI